MILIIFNDVSDTSSDQREERLEATNCRKLHDMRHSSSLIRCSCNKAGRLRLVKQLQDAIDANFPGPLDKLVGGVNILLLLLQSLSSLLVFVLRCWWFLSQGIVIILSKSLKIVMVYHLH